LTRKLTANLGMRYEYATPYSDKFGQVGFFNLDGIEPVTGAKGTFQIAEPGQYQTDPNRKQFSPRVGLAYRLTEKTVIRAAGWGRRRSPTGPRAAGLAGGYGRSR